MTERNETPTEQGTAATGWSDERLNDLVCTRCGNNIDPQYHEEDCSVATAMLWLRAENDRLRAELEQLAKYTRHDRKCNVHTKWLTTEGEHVCTCGLAKALIAARRNPQTEEGAK